MIKRFFIVIIAAFLIISATIFGLAVRANQELERVVSSQFNEQQLALARKIAADIQINFQFLSAALRNLHHEQSLWPIQDRDIREQIPHTFALLQEWGVSGIGLRSTDAEMFRIYTAQGWQNADRLDIGLTDSPAPAAPTHSSAPTVLLSRTQNPLSGPFAGRWVMVMSVLPPLNADSLPVDTAFFILDAQAIAKRYAQNIRSGQTGYAWVVNHNGYFMFHVEEEFNGQDSLTVRQLRNPHLSYQRINDLVRDHLLQGEEGTNWYISGWHWSTIGKMKKLLAYSPVLLSDETCAAPHYWAVGLAAPDTEVYGLIRPIVVRQWLIVGLFMILVMTSFAAFLFVALRWSETLRQEVDRKTEHLRQSETDLRHERDKVKASMEQLVQTQERLVISERFAAIGEAAAHLTHEIKNPLMLIGGFAAQVLRTLEENDPRREKLRIIATEAKRLENLLLDVRDFTRPAQPRLLSANVNTTVHDVLNLVQDKLNEQDVHLDLKLAPDAPMCRFDPDQIKQVLLNLVKNALEAMPHGGNLSIATRTRDQRLEIIITDTGQGIPRDKMKKLFHPFFTTKKKGTGLGLAVSYKIIQDHGGLITAQSKEGHGTSFTITLPLPSAENGKPVQGALNEQTDGAAASGSV